MNTKVQLSNSMHTLMKKTPFEHITVQMISDNAGVSRATFYRHFHDKYELMNWSFHEHANNLLQKFGLHNPKAIFTEVCQFLFENRNYYVKATKVEGENSFIDSIYQNAFDTFKIEYLKRNNLLSLNPKEQIYLEFYCSGSTFVLKSWIERGFQIPVEEMSDLFCKMMCSFLKNLSHKSGSSFYEKKFLS